MSCACVMVHSVSLHRVRTLYAQMTSSQQADLAATSLDGAVKQLLLVMLAPRRMSSLLMDVLQAAREALVEKVVTGIIANSKNEFYYFNKVHACVCVEWHRGRMHLPI